MYKTRFLLVLFFLLQAFLLQAKQDWPFKTLDQIQLQGLSEPEKALEELNKYVKNSKNPLQRAYAEKVRGVIHYFRGDLNKALIFYHKAEKAYHGLKNKTGLPSVYNNLATAYFDLDQEQKSVDYYNKAILLAERLDDYKNLSIAHSNLANTYIKINIVRKSIFHGLKGRKFAKIIPDSSLIFNANNIVASAYNENQMHGKALGIYRENMNLSRLLKDSLKLGVSFSNTGNTFNKLKQIDSSIYYLKMAQGIFESEHFYTGLSQVNNALGYAFYFKNDFKKAVAYYENALYYSRETGSSENLLENYDNLALTFEKLGAYKEALSYMRKRNELYDSLRNLSLDRKILQTEAVYRDKEKALQIKNLAKEKKIEAAKAENRKLWIIAGSILFVLAAVVVLFWFKNMKTKTKIKEESMRMQQMEAEYRLLRAQMNPHFLFNALNSVNSLVLTGKNEKATSMLVKFSRYIRNILNQTVLDYVSLKDEMLQITSYLEIENLRFEKLHYEVLFDLKDEAEGILIPSMIIQPLVENALVHGLMPKKEGELRLVVRVKQVNDTHLEVEIEDNGVGVAHDVNAKKNHKSLSMEINTKRIRQIQPELIQPIALKSSVSGTHVYVQIPFKFVL